MWDRLGPFGESGGYKKVTCTLSKNKIIQGSGVGQKHLFQDNICFFLSQLYFHGESNYNEQEILFNWNGRTMTFAHYGQIAA